MMMLPPAVTTDDLLHALRLIQHATAPEPDDGGGHENAHSIASEILKRADARAAQDAPKGAALSDEQIKAEVFAVLRKWKDDCAWDRYTRETGPYDSTE